MRWQAILAVVAGVATASEAVAQRPPRFDPVTCENGKTWGRIKTCLEKKHGLTLLYETDELKVVALKPLAGQVWPSLALFTLRDKIWVRSNLPGLLNNMTELLSVGAYQTPAGTGIRVDLGTTTQTSLGVDGWTSRGVLRRVHTTVCVPTMWPCRTIMSGCEAYIRGRVYWRYHGEVVWHAKRGLQLRADTAHAGSSCTPPRAFLVGENE